MKKILYVCFAAIIALVTMVACSGSKEMKTDAAGSEETAVDVTSGADLDFKGIREVLGKSNDEACPKDYDFIIDQVEILTKTVSGMNKDEARAWKESLSADDQETVEGLCLVAGIMGKRNKKLSPAQKERLEKILSSGDFPNAL